MKNEILFEEERTLKTKTGEFFDIKITYTLEFMIIRPKQITKVENLDVKERIRIMNESWMKFCRMFGWAVDSKLIMFCEKNCPPGDETKEEILDKDGNVLGYKFKDDDWKIFVNFKNEIFIPRGKQ